MPTPVLVTMIDVADRVRVTVNANPPNDDAHVTVLAGAALISADDFCVNIIKGRAYLNIFGTLNGLLQAIYARQEGPVARVDVIVGPQGQISGSSGIDAYATTLAVKNFGLIAGEDFGLNIDADKGRIINDGTITGTTAIASTNDLAIVNAGKIAGETALDLSGDIGNTVRNTGALTGAVSLGYGADLLVNSGQITGNVDLSSTALGGFVSDADRLINRLGTIDGDISTGAGADSILNTGSITGDIRTGTESDLVDNSRGTIAGKVRLEEGDDTFRPGAALDSADGGTGRNTLDFARSAGIELALDGSFTATGWADGDTFSNFANVIGSATGANTLVGDGGANTLTGGRAADTLNGQAGADILTGGGGNDTLIGDAGRDILTGGAGVDSLTGGLGADTFVFASGDIPKSLTTTDAIADFSAKQGDKIDLSAVDANILIDGDQAFTYIGNAAFSQTAGELRAPTAFVASLGGRVVSGDTNGDGKADFVLVLSNGVIALAGDFVL